MAEIAKAQTFEELRIVVIRSILPDLEQQRSTLKSMVTRHEITPTASYDTHAIQLEEQITQLHSDLDNLETRHD